jgi:type II secretion system protein N
MKQLLLRYAPYAKYAGVVGYPLFYAICLAIFACLTFPYDKLKQRIVASFNADQLASGGQQELQIDAMTGRGLSGVRMSGIALLGAPSEPGKPPTRLAVDGMTIHFSLLSMLVGSSDIDFDADVWGGGARGEYATQGKDKSFDLSLDSVDLGQVGPLVQLLGVPIEGKLSGVMHMTMPEGRLSKGTGDVSLDAKGTAVGDGKAKLKGALALPRIDVGTMTIAADVKDGVMKISKFVASGRDVDVQGDGRITLRDSVTDSVCDMLLRFRINDAYRSKNDMTRSLFGVPGSNAPVLFELADPKIRQSKRADGFYGWSVRGALARLDFFPAPR